MADRSTSALNVMIPALRIEINGELVAIAGAEDLSLLTGTVGLGAGSSREIDLATIAFSVMGIAVGGSRPRQLTWADGVQLKLGDRVMLQVVEVEQPSPPSNVRSSPSTEDLASATLRDAKKRARGGNDA